MNLRLDAEPEWLIPQIVEYVAAVLCASVVGIIFALCII